MRNIQISAENHRLVLFQLLQIREKVVLPFHPIIQPSQTVLGIGCIHCNHIIVRVFQRDYSALVIVFLDSDAVCDRQRFLLCKNRRPGIALFLRIIPELFIARQLHLDLPRLKLRLLQTENIGVRLHKALCHTGAKPIHIP